MTIIMMKVPEVMQKDMSDISGQRIA
jgi:hypothetical protein